jgi:hypothetical protein
MCPTKAKSDLAREAHREKIVAHLAEQESSIALAPVQAGPMDIDLAVVAERLQTIRAFQQLVRSQLVVDHDFGVIPGTNKPTLLKPGAEKIAKLLGLADAYEVCEKIEDWKSGFFAYTIRCRLTSMTTGVLVSEGLGSCNSKESRFAYRWVFPSEVPEDVNKRGLRSKTVTMKRGKATMYRVPNDDIFSQVNTLLKMAKKRALVDAALSAGRLSDLFTQDMEDTRESNGKHAEPPVDAERAAVLKQVQQLLVERYGPDDKEGKAAALKEVFNQRSWQAVSNMPMDILRKGPAVLENQIQQQAGREPGATEAGESDEFDFFLAAGGGQK